MKLPTLSYDSEHYNYGLLLTMEDRATLGSDLSAMWDFAESIAL
jgi:hypothetical protein